VSELASVRSAVQDPRGYRILADRVSQEPLSQLVRQEDIDLFNVFRWTVFAMIGAPRNRSKKFHPHSLPPVRLKAPRAPGA